MPSSTSDAVGLPTPGRQPWSLPRITIPGGSELPAQGESQRIRRVVGLDSTARITLSIQIDRAGEQIAKARLEIELLAQLVACTHHELDPEVIAAEALFHARALEIDIDFAQIDQAGTGERASLLAPEQILHVAKVDRGGQGRKIAIVEGAESFRRQAVDIDGLIGDFTLHLPRTIELVAYGRTGKEASAKIDASGRNRSVLRIEGLV